MRRLSDNARSSLIEHFALSNTLTWRLARLRYLCQRVVGSLARRGLRGTLARARSEFSATQPSPDTDWRLEPLDKPFTPFAIASSEAPQVSVILPVYGKWPYTLACLRSIARHGAAAKFEVIVVDDASEDDTADLLAQVKGIRLLRNPRSIGFVHSCNAGAATARGQWLLFLDNEIQVTPGWLDRLLDCFAEEADCGIAGSRLVHPDGCLREAGGLIYANGEARSYGRGENPHDPRFLYRRDTDYVSRTALMVEAALFARIGGFDIRYAPAYCEDMDLAFAARAAGRRVLYQPSSVIVHRESIGPGSGPVPADKQYKSNRDKFVAKWRAELRQQPPCDASATHAAHHRDVGHIFIVDALAPEPTRDSGSLRLINIMRLLRQMGWRISFMADNRRASAREIALLGDIGVHVLCKPWAPSLANWLAHEGKGLDAVMLCRHYVAQPHIDLVRSLAPDAMLLFDTVDLHFLRERRAAEHSGSTAMARQAELSREVELEVIRASDVTLVVSPVERELLAKEVPEAHVELLSNVHEVPGRTLNFTERRGLVFVGGFGHPPNEDAVRWLLAEIYPLIRAQRPDIDIHIIGDIDEASRRQLAGPGIHLHGRVDKLWPWMGECRISLAPLRYGAGVKGKINTAMSHGLPVVATPIAAEGMQLVDGQDVLLGGDAESFAAAVLRLYDDGELWMQLSDAGLDNVRKNFSFEAARATLQRLLPNPRLLQ